MKKNLFSLILVAIMAAAYSFAVDAKFVANPGSMPYTATTAITAGDVVVLNTELIGVAKNDIASNEVGTVFVEGVYELEKDDTIVSAIGDPVYWNATGNPYGTTTATGAATTTASSNPYIGWAIQTCATNATTVRVMLNGSHPYGVSATVYSLSAYTDDGTNHISKITAYTVKNGRVLSAGSASTTTNSFGSL
jgi:predicted RecA/RadA family phage recombinase